MWRIESSRLGWWRHRICAWLASRRMPAARSRPILGESVVGISGRMLALEPKRGHREVIVDLLGFSAERSASREVPLNHLQMYLFRNLMRGLDVFHGLNRAWLV